MSLRALVLAAGKGTRMVSDVPKVLFPLSGSSIVEHVLNTLSSLGIQDKWVVTGFGRGLVEKKLADQAKFVFQKVQLGTGHAVLSADQAFKNYKGELLILAGDVPLIQSGTLKKLIASHRSGGNSCSCLSMFVDRPHGYGRILRNVTGGFRAIREELEATAEDRQVKEVNTGVYVFNYPKLREVLRLLKPSAKKKELYLTDAVELLLNRGEKVAACPLGGAIETQGINTREELSKLEETMNMSNISTLQSQGVTVVMPSQTYIQKGVKIGRGTVIHPFVWIEKGVLIGSDCEIGPFAKIRAGSKIESKATIGSFVEVVRSRIGVGTRIKHLSYFGDSEVGKNVNVGAGTITANYNGVSKNKTRIGNDVFLGVNTSLIAPVVLGDKVKTGAGAVVTAHQNFKKNTVLVGVPAKELKKGKKK